ncbi:hypothetical protein HYFRA_00011641 [Hymenoscyphus fraxineus]|uniref:PUL domain-containing protein n=1 Tax=Hymenoscyphus fraxineus TaxID=746836 RepID=A0A9N9L1B7_9HELO|nr:hypothetical protein HYFRA_00011641 [Hymenoscyphus fraxineus]
MADYKLSAFLRGHESDARNVIFPNPKTVISASYDGTVRSWKLSSESPPIFEPTISYFGSSYVTCLAFLPPSQQYPEGLIISGGKGQAIDLRQPSKTAEDQAEATLYGHSHQVCALAVDPAGKYIVSGSWDGSARLWPVGKWDSPSIIQQNGKAGKNNDVDISVLAVLCYDSERIITASMDGMIHIYISNGVGGKLSRSISTGSEPQRALCALKNHPTGADFASAGSDGIIRLWRISGQRVGEIFAHEDYIFSLDCLPSGEIFSASEDKTLRIWNGSDLVQTITHPTISVWSVSVCQETGDVVTGTSQTDKMGDVLRVFSRDPKRIADAETLQEFDNSLKEWEKKEEEKKKKAAGEEYPGPRNLKTTQGTKDGQVKLIQEYDGSVRAYAWNASESNWDLQGIYKDSPEQVEHKGKKYDYKVEVETERQGTLYCAGYFHEDPAKVADRFLNEAQVTGAGDREDFKKNFVDSIKEKYPAIRAKCKDVEEEKAEEAEKGKESARARIDTRRQFIRIMDTKTENIEKSIIKLNKALIDSGKKDLSLNSKELQTLFACCKAIGKLQLAHYKSTKETLEICVKIITQWPYSDRMAGMDLIRLISGQSESATYRDSQDQDIISILISSCQQSNPPNKNYIMMTMRAVANLFVSAPGVLLAKSQFPKYQALITTTLADGLDNRNLLIAVTTIYHNLGVACHISSGEETAPPPQVTREILTTLPKILQYKDAKNPADSEVAARGLRALATLVSLGGEVKNSALELGFKEAVEEVVRRFPESRIGELGVELGELIAVGDGDVEMRG